jgi:hypothetical protein
MQPITSSTVAYLAFASLVAWRVYARFRRMIGRQRLSKYRAPVTLALFGTLVVLVAMASVPHLDRLLWLAAALSCGFALGIFGLNRTRLEAVPGQGFFYTPNAPLGIALSLLFVARIAYRVYEVYVLDPNVPRGATEFAQSPLTLCAFGLLAGYYISYAVGLARWRARVLRAKKAREASRPDA